MVILLTAMVSMILGVRCFRNDHASCSIRLNMFQWIEQTILGFSPSFSLFNILYSGKLLANRRETEEKYQIRIAFNLFTMPISDYWFCVTHNKNIRLDRAEMSKPHDSVAYEKPAVEKEKEIAAGSAHYNNHSIRSFEVANTIIS